MDPRPHIKNGECGGGTCDHNLSNNQGGGNTGRSLEAHRPVSQAHMVKFQAIEMLSQAKIGRHLRTIIQIIF